MLYAKITPARKRENLRAALNSGRIQRFPGAFNPLSAKLIQTKGFEGVYISGAVLSADLGLPDIGLITLSEVAGRAQQIARMTDLPAIVDADTGFGEPMNVARTIQMSPISRVRSCTTPSGDRRFSGHEGHPPAVRAAPPARRGDRARAPHLRGFLRRARFALHPSRRHQPELHQPRERRRLAGAPSDPPRAAGCYVRDST